MVPETSLEHKKGGSKVSKIQLCTFFVDQQLYGIDVIEVQEVVKHLPIIPVPLAAKYVRGLINLRGQVATALGLREMFALSPEQVGFSMNIILRQEGSLVSLQVDEIGDVVELDKFAMESIPATIPDSIREFMAGVYQIKEGLLCVIDLTKLITKESEAA